MSAIPFHLTRAEVRDLDRRAIEDYGVPGIVLMENAGRGVAELLLRLNREGQPVTIFCGPGNNGGDGYVMARHLQNRGCSPEVWQLAPPKAGTDADINLRIWQRGGVVRDFPAERWIDFRSGWIVDALFGTGLDRPLTSPFAEIVTQINASGNPVLAVDIPSGLDCDSGQPLGPTVRANHTATFVTWKQGFLEVSAQPWLGEVHVIDIGAPKKLVDEFRRQGDEPRGESFAG